MANKAVMIAGKWDETHEDVLSQAYQVGRIVARLGYVVVSGCGDGVMDASLDGAKSANGFTIGFVGDDGATTRTDNVDFLVKTSMDYDVRSILAVKSSDLLITVGGANGTLGEISCAYLNGINVVCIANSGGISENINSLCYDGKHIDRRHNSEVLTMSISELETSLDDLLRT